MLKRSSARALLTLLIFVGVACRDRSSSSAPAKMIDVVSADAEYVLSSTDLLSMAQAIDGYLGAATQKAGPLTEFLRKAATDELGFDPLTAEGYQSVGIDPALGFVVSSSGKLAEPIVVVGITDRKKFLTWLKGIMRRIDGVSTEEETTIDGVSILRFGRPFGAQEVPVASAHVDAGIAWLTTSKGEGALVAKVKQRQDPAGMARLVDDAGYQELNRMIPDEWPLRVFARRSALAMIEEVDSAALGWTLSDRGMSADIFLKTDLSRFRAILGDAPTHELTAQVGSDAVFVSMSNAARPEVLEFLRAIPTLRSRVDRVLTGFSAETGIDLESDVLGLLAGPTTSAVYLNDPSHLGLTVQIGGAMLQGMMDGVDASFSARLKDQQVAIKRLDQAAERLRKLGRTVRRREAKRRGKPIVRYAPDEDSPRVAWAVYDGSYLYAEGAGRLDKLLDVVDGKLESFSLEGTAARAWSKEPATGIVILRLERVADVAEGFSQALSGAPGGAIANTVTSILQSVGDLALSIDAPEGALRLRYRQAFKK